MAKDVLVPILPSAWNERTARHLLNRVGFGVPRARVASLLNLGPAQAVNEFVDYESNSLDVTAPEYIPDEQNYRGRRAEMAGLSEEEQRRANREYTVRERAQVLQLRGWWIGRMATTPRPLQEKLALFWHGHFATSAQKVRPSLASYHLNAVFREHALGNVKTLTTAVGKSPAMLRYLDNFQNVKGRPNENWARELMELFTMGPGNYSEQDIKESARAFTGWSHKGSEFVFNRRRHDDGKKTFLGRTSDFDGDDILGIIFEQRATAEFLCAKLFAYFTYADPEAEIVSALADTLRAHDYELKPMLRQLFRSKVF